MNKKKEINSRIVRLNLIDGTQINGQTNISKGVEGYDRLSDLMGSTKEDFIVLMSATVYQKNLDNPIKHEVLFVNKSHILWATPESTQA